MLTIDVRAVFSFTGVWLLAFAMLPDTSMSAKSSIAKPGCPSKCGNVTIPYPFGIAGKKGCSLSETFNIHCNTSFHPPKPFLVNSYNSLEIIDISNDGQLRIRNTLAYICYPRGKSIGVLELLPINVGISLDTLPLVVSATSNKFFVIGCNNLASISEFYTANDSPFATINRVLGNYCVPKCTTLEDTLKQKNKPCSKLGCCQLGIPYKGMKGYSVSISSLSEDDDTFGPITNTTFPFCDTAFVAEESKFNIVVDGISLSNHKAFMSEVMHNVPVVLDWYVGGEETCNEAKLKPSKLGYACKENTKCTDVDADIGPGYRCSCLPGYQGNPYFSPGCTDIDECASSSNLCSHLCENTIGSYRCFCPKGLRGDGLKNGTRCFDDNSTIVRGFGIGISLGLVGSIILVWRIYVVTNRRKLLKIRKKYFKLNGGLLLINQLSSSGEASELFKIYTEDELKEATNNFNETCILGKGGYGTVYKGISKDGRELAIKRSKVADEIQVEQFVNELVILTQINHRNVVKLFGCCLETEVPLLVYEFISNGTLFDHIHGDKEGVSWLTWGNCVRIAVEAADAISYLHSAASIPIIHRDIKSTNILLSEDYTIKISDFGTSKLVPIDQTRGTTLVLGTLGYLDPEYFNTSHLTEKSDVYGFGVVLAELLTKQKPLSTDRKPEEANLATYFRMSVEGGHLMDILDPQLVKEATEEQLVTMANLVYKCLNVASKDRPTMKEVAIELEELRRKLTKSWSDEKYEEATNLTSQEKDLYPVPLELNIKNPSNDGECSDQYKLDTDIITEMNQPR